MITFHGMLEYDPTLFDGVTLPNGIDKDVLVRKIDRHCGELICYYPIPSRFKSEIEDWFNVEKFDSFKRMIDALNEEYDPLHNYDRNEEWKDNGKVKVEGDVDTTMNSHGESENKVSAYDSSTYAPQGLEEHEEHSGQHVDNDSTTTTNSGHSGHLYGNIGVTTSQQMLREEYELRLNTNIYDSIARQFEKTFMVQVY